MSIEEKLRVYIVQAQLPGEDPDILQLDDDLIDSGILDSMGIMQLVTHLEKEYDIQIPSEEIEPDNFQTVKSLALYVEKKRLLTEEG